jgi:S-adenosylmethionine-diacylgycerolhomoserine-N-methlytransferase
LTTGPDDPSASESRAEHRDFLNRYYGMSRHIYDWTRKYYLFGRDAALARLLDQPWQRLIEAGVGTGRNLRKLQKRRPSAEYGGIDASDEMLRHAARRCPWAKLTLGFVEDAPYGDVLGQSPDRILFSYCLSMVGDANAAITHARRSVAPGGEVAIVDFGDMRGLARPLREGLRAWLRTFHVTPIDPSLVGAGTSQDAPLPEIFFGPFRYFFIARLPRLP